MKVVFMMLVVITGLYSCQLADKNLKEKDFTKVLNSPPFDGLTDSITRFPDNPELHLQRASLLSRNNYHELATPDYKKTWELTGDENIALEYVSNLLLADEVRQAILILRECSEKFPSNAEFRRRLAEVYRQQEQPEKALAQYDTILSKDSLSFETWFDRGTLLARMKDTAAAINSLERSFSLMPVNYTGIALANLYVNRKDPRALEVCDIMLSKDTTSTITEPVFLKGVYYTEIKQYDKAIILFDECIARDWKMTDAYIEKGIIFYERKNYTEALKIFNMAATVSNTDADTYYWMGRCFESSGDQEQAIQNYERALALDNSFTEASEGLRRLRR